MRKHGVRIFSKRHDISTQCRKKHHKNIKYTKQSPESTVLVAQSNVHSPEENLAYLRRRQLRVYADISGRKSNLIPKLNDPKYCKWACIVERSETNAERVMVIIRVQDKYRLFKLKATTRGGVFPYTASQSTVNIDWISVSCFSILAVVRAAAAINSCLPDCPCELE